MMNRGDGGGDGQGARTISSTATDATPMEAREGSAAWKKALASSAAVRSASAICLPDLASSIVS